MENILGFLSINFYALLVIIAVAILTAANVEVECLPATTTSPTPIKINPRFPKIIG